MSVKLVLTQIMKNESHVANRMLNSILPIVDALCIVDTGSTDDSIEVVKKWGEDNNIPTYVFERPFDNFENSRNHSIEKAREIFLKDEYKNDEWFAFWLDFDEQLVIDKSFSKNSITKDIYMFNAKIGNMKYTRNEMFRLSKPFRFYGPIHEFLVSDDKNITSGLLESVLVDVKMDGASWKSDIPTKYKMHAFELEKYIDKDRKDPRWIFYTAQSWHDSSNTGDREENEERLRRSMKYYKERISRNDGYFEERYYSQYRVGVIMGLLEMPWKETHQELLKAHTMDPLRGESIKSIIDHYLRMGEWQNAYIYTKFAVSEFHGRNPYPKRLLFVEQSLYEWKFLESHSFSCFYTGRKEEAKKAHLEILNIMKTKPELFTEDESNKIKSNSNLIK